jgi:hypothetical protein
MSPNAFRRVAHPFHPHQPAPGSPSVPTVCERANVATPTAPSPRSVIYRERRQAAQPIDALKPLWVHQACPTIEEMNWTYRRAAKPGAYRSRSPSGGRFGAKDAAFARRRLSRISCSPYGAAIQ